LNDSISDEKKRANSFFSASLGWDTMSALEPVRILLVDDNPADAMLAKELLLETKLPATVSVVTDGEYAIAMIEEMLKSKMEMPELVLLDLNIPRRNGHEVLRLLRGMPSILTMLIVIYSGSRSPIDLETARAGGANGYIVKPIDAGEMDETIVAFKELLQLLIRMKSNDNC
jgi:chemotaxis family two-component system response regulator Rcp1